MALWKKRCKKCKTKKTTTGSFSCKFKKHKKYTSFDMAMGKDTMGNKCMFL